MADPAIVAGDLGGCRSSEPSIASRSLDDARKYQELLPSLEEPAEFGSAASSIGRPCDRRECSVKSSLLAQAVQCSLPTRLVRPMGAVMVVVVGVDGGRGSPVILSPRQASL